MAIFPRIVLKFKFTARTRLGLWVANVLNRVFRLKMSVKEVE